MSFIYVRYFAQYFFKAQAKNFYRLSLALCAFFFPLVVVSAQEAKVSPTPTLSTARAENTDDLIRVNTNLIQTGVSVLDRNGKFVPNLKQEDFELRVDGKLIPISFFEEFAGQIVQKNKSDKSAATNNRASSIANRQGKIILFVVDDVHLAFDNFVRARDLISKFIENEKKPEDYVAIASSTGKIGFLQQFTNDAAVLRAALARLAVSRDYSARDRAFPPMSEFEAQSIDRDDKEVVDAFTEITLRDYPPNLQNDPKTIELVKEQIHSRAKDILAQSQTVSRITYNALDQSLAQSGKIDGRKIVFFLSDGFLLDVSNTNSSARIDKIIDAAARVNAVIYSIDTKGLDASLPEGTTTAATSFRIAAGSRFESQDALSAFAKKTGGSFIHNTNEPLINIKKALEDASYYYLLAWEPADENIKQEKLRQIEVTVHGNPKLEVKFQSGYLSANNQTPDDKSKIESKKDAKTPEIAEQSKALTASNIEMQKALFAPLPVRALPTDILINYSEKPEGSFLFGSVHVIGGDVELARENDKETGKVELVGIIYDSDGKRIDYFDKVLSIEYAASTSPRKKFSDFQYDFQTKVNPGLYQVRMATRDLKSGRIGSNLQWIEIPNLATGKLELSSLFLAERKISKPTQDDDDDENSDTSSAIQKTDSAVSKRFECSSNLQYKFYIYNFSPNPANPNDSKPEIQIQILRDNNLVATIPFNQESLTQAAATQFLYAAEIPLATLAAGQYQLQVKARNTATKVEAAQTSNFEIK